MEFLKDIEELKETLKRLLEQDGSQTEDEFIAKFNALSEEERKLLPPNAPTFEIKRLITAISIRTAYENNNEVKDAVNQFLSDEEYENLDEFYEEYQANLDDLLGSELGSETYTIYLDDLRAKEAIESKMDDIAKSKETKSQLKDNIDLLLRKHSFVDLPTFVNKYKQVHGEYNTFLKDGRPKRAESRKKVLQSFSELKKLVGEYQEGTFLNVEDVDDAAASSSNKEEPKLKKQSEVDAKRVEEAKPDPVVVELPELQEKPEAKLEEVKEEKQSPKQETKAKPEPAAAPQPQASQVVSEHRTAAEPQGASESQIAAAPAPKEPSEPQTASASQAAPEPQTTSLPQVATAPKEATVPAQKKSIAARADLEDFAINADSGSESNMSFDVSRLSELSFESVDSENEAEIYNTLIERAKKIEISEDQTDREGIEYNEIVKQYHEVIEKYPSCAEKTLIVLTLFFEAVEKKKEEEYHLLSKETIDELSKLLHVQLQREGLIDKKVSRFLSKMSLVEKNSNSFHKTMSESAFGILRYVQQINLRLLLKLVSQSVEAERRIQGNDIILLLGLTGTGKTTSIQFLSGAKMRKTFKYEGIKHIEPDPDTVADALKDFVSTPFGRSETRSVNALEIPYKDEKGQEQITLLCDSPGFGDTGGAEYDIANGIAVVRAVRACKRVLPVILVSQQSIGDRLEGIIKLVKILSMFIPNMEEHVESMVYIFTKFSKDQADEIHPKLKNKVKYLSVEERNNPGLVALLSDMIKKTESSVRILDPINDVSSEYHTWLHSVPKIENKSTLFAEYNTQESLSKLHLHIQNEKNAIHVAFRRVDTAVVDFKMGELRQVSEYLENASAIDAYQELIQYMKITFEENIENIRKKINRTEDVPKETAKEILSECANAIFILMKYDTIREHHTPELTNFQELCLLLIKKRMKQLSVFVLSVFPKEISAESKASDAKLIQDYEVMSKRTIRALDQMQLLLELFQEKEECGKEFGDALAGIYKETCEELTSRLDGYNNAVMEDIQKNNFVRISLHLTLIKLFSEWNAFEKVFANKYQMLVMAVKIHLETSLEATCTALSAGIKDEFQLTDIELYFKNILKSEHSITHTVGAYFNALEAYQLESHIKRDFKKDVALIEEKLVEAFKVVKDKILPFLKADKQIHFYNEVAKILGYLGKLRANTQIKTITDPIYASIVHELRLSVVQTTERCKQILTSLEHDARVDIPAFITDVIHVSSANVFDGYPEAIYQGELNQLSSLAQKFREKHILFSEQIDFASHTLDDLKKYANHIALFKNLIMIDSHIFDNKLKENLNQMTSKFLSHLVDVEKKTKKLKNEKIKSESILRVCNYAFAFQATPDGDIQGQIRSLLKLINASVEQMFRQFESSFEKQYKIITEFKKKEADILKSAKTILMELQYYSGLIKVLESLPSDEPVDGMEGAGVSLKTVDYVDLRNTLENIKAFVSKTLDGPESTLGKMIATLQKDVEHVDANHHDDNVYTKLSVCETLRDLDRLRPGMEGFQIVSLKMRDAVKRQEQGKINELQLLSSTKNITGFVDTFIDIRTHFPELMSQAVAIYDDFKQELSSDVKQIELQLEQFEITDPNCLDVLQGVNEKLLKISFLNKLQDIQSDKLVSSLSKQLENIISKTPKRILAFKPHFERFISQEKFIPAFEVLVHMKAVTDRYHVSPELDHVASKSLLKVFSSTVEQLLDTYKISKKLLIATLKEKNKHYKIISVDQYETSGIFDYIHVLYELKKKEPYFDRAYDELIQHVEDSLKDIIKLIIKNIAQTEVDDRIFKIKRLVLLLPQEVSKKLLEQANELEDRTKKEQEKRAKLRKEVDSTHNLHEHYKILQQWGAQRRHADVVYGGEKIYNSIISAIDRHRTNLQKGEIVEVLKSVTYSWPLWLDFAGFAASYQVPKRAEWYHISTTYVPLYAQDFTLRPYKKLILDVSNKASDSVNEIVFSLSSFNVSNTLIMLEKNFPVMRELLQVYFFYCNSKMKHDHIYDFLSKSNRDVEIGSLKKILHQLVTFFCLVEEKFIEIIKSDNIGKIVEIMDSLKKHHKFLQQFKDFFSDPKIKPYFDKETQMLGDIKLYDVMKRELANAVMDLKEKACARIYANPKASLPNTQDRIDFNETIVKSYNSIHTLVALSEHIDDKIVDVHQLHEEAFQKITKNIQEVKEQVEALIKRIPSDRESYEKLNIWFSHIQIAAKIFPGSLVSTARAFLSHVERAMLDKLEAVRKTYSKQLSVEQIILVILNFKMISLCAPEFRKHADAAIDKLLHDLKESQDGIQKVGKIGVELNKISDEYQDLAQMLIADHESFKSYATELRNEKTLRFKIDNVLSAMRNDRENVDLHVDRLSQQFAEFETTYWPLVTRGLIDLDDTKVEVIRDAKKLADSKEAYDVKVVKLTAYLFAYWTMQKSTLSTDADGNLNRSGVYQPHPAQVVSIFRALGIDGSNVKSKEKALQNHLIEIGTGEGKSVTLAIASSILVLFGYQVDCACYSEYLSERDYYDFEELFCDFSIERHISYGTFGQLCEAMINRQGDIRQLVTGTITGDASKMPKASKSKRPKIIIIDEVDVFFNKQFYGSCYRSLSPIKDKTVSDLAGYIWSIRHDKSQLKLSNILSSTHFNACKERFSHFPGWATLVEEAAKAMFADVNTFDEYPYMIVRDRIAYKSQHGTDDTMTYRYKTMFAYFYEHDHGNLTTSSRDANTAILLDSGAFSYAEIPEEYECILGLTGTLRTLSEPETRILTEHYKIKKFTYMPSVYGKNQLEFAGDNARDRVVVISDENGYHHSIQSEINKRLPGILDMNYKRAVMVFFKDRKSLFDFYQSPYTVGKKKDYKIITEDLDDDQKDSLIRQAASSGTITLMTREFGRGTDFRCYDERMSHQGGVHVIQTFVSDELSEETQIKGRTARQGDKGSYSLVLLDVELDRYYINKQDIDDMEAQGRSYSTIDAHRTRFFQNQYEENLKNIDRVKEDHKASMKFIKALLKQKKSAIKDFLIARNETVLPQGDFKTMVMMDSTWSMSALIQKTKNTVATMFERAYNVLQDKGYGSTFELRFVAYRNYLAPAEMLLEYSSWETEPASLRQFLANVEPCMGLGNEAIEVAMQFANRELQQETEIDQIILIGDMPPNTQAEVTHRRASNHGGESYWSRTDYHQPTFYWDEVQEIRSRSIPIHAFYVKTGEVESAFQQIASATGGASRYLDIDSDQGADDLCHLVTTAIMNSIGGKELADAYIEKFAPGFVSPYSNNPNRFLRGSRSSSANQADAAASPSSSTSRVAPG